MKRLFWAISVISVIFVALFVLYKYKRHQFQWLKPIALALSKDTLVIKVAPFSKDGPSPKNLPSKLLKNILKEKYNVKISTSNYDLVIDRPDNDIYRDYNKFEELDPKIIKIFFTPEAILPNLNNYDLTIGFDKIDDAKYIRVPWYYFSNFNTKIRTDYNREADQGKCNPNKRYFACFLVTNNSEGDNWRNHKPFDGCLARTKIFNKLSTYKRVESGGKYLNNIGRVIPPNETMEWLSNCKFIIAYENQSYDGYITEKPFQAYFAGAIPIYYGHPTAVTDMNKDAIIYAGDFNNEDDLVEYIKKVDNDEDLYCKIWHQNIITAPERNFETVRSKLADKIYQVIDQKLKK